MQRSQFRFELFNGSLGRFLEACNRVGRFGSVLGVRVAVILQSCLERVEELKPRGLGRSETLRDLLLDFERASQSGQPVIWLVHDLELKEDTSELLINNDWLESHRRHACCRKTLDDLGHAEVANVVLIKQQWLELGSTSLEAW